MKLKNFYFASLLLSFLIFSCSEDEEPTPDTLVVNAGTDQTVDVGELVTLAGTATDASGNALSFSWVISTKPSGSTASLSGSTGQAPTFTPDVEGEYVVTLSVNNTVTTKTDDVKITAEGVPLKTIELSGTITEDSILVDIFTDDTPDYLVTGNLTINGTAKLTIKPGVIIAVEADERIWVDGDATIEAIGTADNKIIFTGKQESAGYWKGLVIWTKSNENILDYVEVKYGGSGDHGFGIGKTTLGIGDEGKLSIKNSIISNSGDYGLFVETAATFNEFMNNEIKNNTGIAAAMNISQTEKLDNISKFSEGNGDNSIELFGSTLDQSVAITVPAFDDKTPYYVSGNLEVNSGLIVSPGVTFAFSSDKRFWVDDEGYLTAIGTELLPIVFTGKDKTVGYWKGLAVWTNNLDNKLDYVEVSYGGSSDHGFGIGKTSLGIGDDGKCSITNSTISFSDDYGLFVERDASINDFSNNKFMNNKNIAMIIGIKNIAQLDSESSFTDNGDNSVEVVASTLTGTIEVTWPALSTGAAYFVTGNLEINTGVSVSPGAIFKVGSDKRIWIDDEGYMTAKGDASNKIIFTGKSETAGYWKGLVYWTNNTKNEMEFVEVSYGGSSAHGFGVDETNLGLGDSGKLSVKNSTFTNSAGFGIFAEAGTTLTQESNTFSSNASGDLN